MAQQKTVLVTGATGYVGGRLIPRLLAAGHCVRALARSIEKAADRPWAEDPGVTLVEADARDVNALTRAAEGCAAAYYLIRSKAGRRKKILSADRRFAENVRTAAERGGLRQIIYLGDLGPPDADRLPAYLASRRDVGLVLKSGTVPVTVLRAGMIIGSGNVSFEILRYMTERLPWMLGPRWFDTPTQPIAISNVLNYLIGCLLDERVFGQTFDIGGPEVLSFRQLVHIFARTAGLPPRHVVPFPAMAPRSSAQCIHWVTPVPSVIALPFVQGLSVPSPCTENRIQQIVPQSLLTCAAAISRALERLRDDQVETSWSDAGALRPPEWALRGDDAYAGGTLVSCAYRLKIEAPAEAVWKPVLALGGSRGYYFGDLLWRLRGWMDRQGGGVGLHRGRRSPTQVRVGDALDFWRVLRVVPNQRLTLIAEMQVPGQALLDVQVAARGPRTTELRIIARFRPKGLGGLVYWYALYPSHILIFSGMARAIARQSGGRPAGSPEKFNPDNPAEPNR